MNALKIAKDLDREGKFPGHICYGTSPLLVRAANMLRKQQAEIGALKQIIDANNLNQNIGQFVKPTLKIEEVMSENCTCYKLGYSPLNDYALVKQK